jgi:hypothetical protein
MLQDISRNGARIVVQDGIELPKTFVLDFSGNIVVRRLCELVWQNGEVAGVQFRTLDGFEAKQFESVKT